MTGTEFMAKMRKQCDHALEFTLVPHHGAVQVKHMQRDGTDVRTETFLYYELVEDFEERLVVKVLDWIGRIHGCRSTPTGATPDTT